MDIEDKISAIVTISNIFFVVGIVYIYYLLINLEKEEYNKTLSSIKKVELDSELKEVLVIEDVLR